MNKEQIIAPLISVCHSDPKTKDGEYCLTEAELLSFAQAIQDKQREAGYSEEEVQRAAACSGHTYDEWLKIKAYLPVRHNKE